MYGKVRIGDQDIAMIANAATPLRFKQVFKRDLLRILIKNSEFDEKRRKLLDEKAKEFREAHTPEEASELIEKKKAEIDEEIRRQEEITGQTMDLDEVKRYTTAVDALAQELIPQETIDEFEDQIYASYDTTRQLAYIMAKQAAASVPSDMAKISLEDFWKWLEQFGPHDIEAVSDEIMAIYNGTAESDPEIVPKKESAGSTETLTQPFTRSE